MTSPLSKAKLIFTLKQQAGIMRHETVHAPADLSAA